VISAAHTDASQPTIFAARRSRKMGLPIANRPQQIERERQHLYSHTKAHPLWGRPSVRFPACMLLGGLKGRSMESPLGIAGLASDQDPEPRGRRSKEEADANGPVGARFAMILAVCAGGYTAL